jgi:hypothetical protein
MGSTIKFLYNIPGYHGEDEWRPIEGLDAEDAASEAGKLYDEDEHPLLRDESESVVVYIKHAEAEPGTEEPERFVVSAYVSYNYTAEAKERKEGDPPDNGW